MNKNIFLDVNVSRKLFIVALFIIVLFPLLMLGDNPGLYYDAVNPDYGAVCLLHPQNQYSKLYFAAYPMLCQIYHGSFNVLLSLIDTVLTGKTSVLQHHLESGIVIFFCLLMVGFILEQNFGRCKKNWMLLIFFATMPCLVTFPLTQYYIELPGTFFTLLSLFLYGKMRKELDDKKSLLLMVISFYVLGFAFYTYYNFLFFFPGMLVLSILQKNGKMNCFKAFILSCFSFLAGAVLYPIGYLKMFLVWKKYGDLFIPLALFVFLAIYGATLILLWIACKKDDKIFSIAAIIASLFGIAFFVLFIYKFYPRFSEIATALNVGGDKADLKTRFLKLFHYIKVAFSGTDGEFLIYGTIQSKFQFSFFCVFLILNCIYLVYSIKTKRWINSLSLRLLFIVALYFLCSLKFATRMQTQHFVPFAFIFFLLAAIEINELLENTLVLRVRKVLFFILGLFFLCNIHDRYKIVSHILYTGGTINYMYTNQINKLAYDAIDHIHNGQKEIYLFPEWGFLTGFCYLTENRIAYSTDIRDSALTEYTERGYTIIICSWKDITPYEEKLRQHDLVTERQIYLQNNGDVAFYTVRAIAKGE